MSTPVRAANVTSPGGIGSRPFITTPRAVTSGSTNNRCLEIVKFDPLSCEQHHVRWLDDAQAEGLPNRQRNKTRRQMCVVALDHARARMPQLRSYYGKRHAIHNGARGVGVAQVMKRDRWLDLGRLACRAKRTVLLALAP